MLDRFVLDYLLEEVLNRQPPGVQTFMLSTSILDRMCGPLCDAVVNTRHISAVWMNLLRSAARIASTVDQRGSGLVRVKDIVS